MDELIVPILRFLGWILAFALTLMVFIAVMKLFSISKTLKDILLVARKQAGESLPEKQTTWRDW